MCSRTRPSISAIVCGSHEGRPSRSHVLTHLLTFVGEPRAGLLHETELDGDVEHRTFATDAWPYMMSNSACLKAQRTCSSQPSLAYGCRPRRAVLDGLDATDVEANRRVELERSPPG